VLFEIFSLYFFGVLCYFEGIAARCCQEGRDEVTGGTGRAGEEGGGVGRRKGEEGF